MHSVSDSPEPDRDEFTEFYKATEAGLRAYARRCVRDASLADDLVQEAYVRLLTSSKAGLPSTERRMYLFRITTNLARDHWRKNRRYEPWTEAEEYRRSIRRPRAGSQDGGRELDVSRALEQVPPKYRLILWLAYVEELDHKEIAEAVNVSRLSVKVMLYRGRKMMAKLLEGNA
jgi:RNA polymerase sigma-70 factor (ECF subfamily)